MIIESIEKEFRLNNKLLLYNSDKTEIMVRCPYCGDSNNKNHAHFYIKSTTPYEFFCQKCEIKGYLNEDNLKDFNIYNDLLFNDLYKEIKEYKKNYLIY